MISPLAYLGEIFRIIATKIDRIELTFTNLFCCDFVNNEYASFALKDLTELSQIEEIKYENHIASIT